MVLFLWIVALATIAALSAALMVLISAAVGILLRFTHQDIAPRHLFVLVRRYGLWRGLYTLARIAWPKRFHLFSRGSSDNWWTALMIVVVVPGCGFVAASFLPVIAAALFCTITVQDLLQACWRERRCLMASSGQFWRHMYGL